ncbi:hypothetical protein CI109_106270 [Kwoniella shandongensis]|uniref:HCP-like protein n=1 Tax=Kwoniella shandongensis TaxID=1734106 RepID=A0AAJ8LN63_9TREE
MRVPRLVSTRRLLLVLLFTFAIASPSFVLAEESASEDGPIQDVCASLREAQIILATLQPSQHAHLDKKVGGTIAPFGSRGWAEGLGWSQEGPLATTFRLLPRLLNSILSPSTYLSRIPILSSATSPRKGTKIGKIRRERVEKMLGLLDEAERGGCEEVWRTRGKLYMFPPKGVKQDLPTSYAAYARYLESSADPEAQFLVGFFHATGLGGVEQDQGKALLYYTFAAVQGYRPATMALGYRHWAGIGDCLLALDHYQAAADKSYQIFQHGPPGGRTLPLTHTRLSDRVGGIYGPHASWASTGTNALRPAIRASSASARGETESEILEYYQYHSDRDSHLYTVGLGRRFYHGSVYFSMLAGVSAGADGVGEIPQSFTKAKEYFMKVARTMWPVDFESDGSVALKRKMSKEMEESISEPARVAASFLGRMAMRGEGQKPDYRRARLWYERAVELGDREALNGLGIIHRDGLAVTPDRLKASHYFQAAAAQDLAEAQVNLAKLHLERGEIAQAVQFLDVALRHGATFEAFHLLAAIHASNARTGLGPGMCGVAVAYEKLVAERGSWNEDWVGEADKAWLRGEEDKALVGWWIGAEMGYETGQNNVAFYLEKGEGQDGPAKTLGATKRDWDEGLGDKVLALWVRSAAQDNVDAMVKVGDHCYESTDPAYDKAVAYYQTAADTQSSAMAYWNLGFMYENGKGVVQDWHLAKRFYDLAKETSVEAYLPVMLSLVKLYVRSWWIDIKTGGATPGLSLFEVEPTDLPPMTTWDRIKALFTDPFPQDNRPGGEGLLEPFDEDGNLENDDSAVYDDNSGHGWIQGEGYGDEDEEFLEDMVILGLLAGTVGLVWVRARWAAAEREREERRRREGILPGGVEVPQ